MIAIIGTRKAHGQKGVDRGYQLLVSIGFSAKRTAQQTRNIKFRNFLRLNNIA
jgi:hypothetical protein